MNTYQNNVQSNITDKETSYASGSGERKSGASNFELSDNRPEAIAQRKLTAGSQDTDQSKQIKQLQESEGASSVTQDSIQKIKNNTGLPDNLKSGVESMSGYSLDDVKVHYNSDKPAQLQAHAYAQGTDIHIAPGQEKHLPHEAWHVVQQKQGRVKPTMQLKSNIPVNDDAGLEKEADVMGARALQMKSDPDSEKSVETSLNTTKTAQWGSPVQMLRRGARVIWGITHLVRVQEDPAVEEDDDDTETLFGNGDNWQAGEVSLDQHGELSQGQKLVVDDEEVFMSRRGSNQEDPEKRNKAREDDEMKHEWLKVLELEVDHELEDAPEDAYVRSETIKLDPPRPRNIVLMEHNDDDQHPFERARVSGELSAFHQAWVTAERKRRRNEKHVKSEHEGQENADHDDLTSGWNWDKFDEGLDVSENMSDPNERTGWFSPATVLVSQRTISARYNDEHGEEAIAYMVLEVRRDKLEVEDDDDNPPQPYEFIKLMHDQEPYMYIRWLIGHPEKGGGASKLIKEAFDSFNRSNCTELRVESAYSAVPWYEKMGFKKVHPEKKAPKKGEGYADTELVYKGEE
ncbi:DUF4157 domain-containing protein [uncultured Fluviicola sp.]|uniref:GNAT family N-acetyltransferase n=1 Tax=uncultured Fluviicola sp. TaxID=463303 RepID=UPI0025EA37B2|nr:DUF4157 domain-containing protein [uncultured Fluviicola sp.]